MILDSSIKDILLEVVFFYLESVVIEKAEPTFSAETDSEGFPIWGTIQLDISSLFTTVQDINKFGKSSYNSG